MNEELDKKIIETIRSGRNTFLRINIELLPVVGKNFRLLDRRLQSLRKRGIIAYKRSDGWSVASSRTCSNEQG